MITDQDIKKVRQYGTQLADFLALQSFDKTPELLAELVDLVNEHRDSYIDRAHKAIARTMDQPGFPADPRLVANVKKLNSAIKMMQGERE